MTNEEAALKVLEKVVRQSCATGKLEALEALDVLNHAIHRTTDEAEKAALLRFAERLKAQSLILKTLVS